MFDHLETTQKQHIAQVKAACKALKFIRSVTAEDTLPRRRSPAQWVRHSFLQTGKQAGVQMLIECSPYFHLDSQ